MDRTPQNSILAYKDDGTLKTIAEIEREMITLALIYSSGGISKAARALGIGRSTFYRKIDEGLDGRKV